MLIEGKGKVPPSAEIVRLSASEYEFVRTVAVKRAAFRNYAGRRDQWGVGMVPNSILVGLLGEHGLCSFINKRTNLRTCINERLLANGDGGHDVDIDGLTLEMKVRVRGRHFLVRRVDDRKRIRQIKSEIVVFAQLKDEREIHLMGWMTRSQVRSQRHIRSPVGDWWNLEIDESELHHMEHLIEEIRFRREV